MPAYTLSRGLYQNTRFAYACKASVEPVRIAHIDEPVARHARPALSA